jgi:hypothetical protein
MWQIRGQMIKGFGAAESIAFELCDLCHKKLESMIKEA